MASISKEEMNQAKENARVLQALDQAIIKLTDKKRNAENTIRLNYKKIQSAEVEKVLAGMGIDKINIDKDGIRVAPLQNAGIHTILQASQMSALQLQSIEGVGETTAAKIESNAKLLKLSVEQSAQVTLQVDNSSSEISTIIENLYYLIQNDKILKDAQALYNTYHDGIQRSVSNVQLLSSGLKWMFTSKENKEVAYNAAVALQEVMAGEFGRVAPQLVEAYNTINDNKITVKDVDLQLLRRVSMGREINVQKKQADSPMTSTVITQPTVSSITTKMDMEQSVQVESSMAGLRERSAQEIRLIGGPRFQTHIEETVVKSATSNLEQVVEKDVAPDYTANVQKVDCFTAFRQNSAPFYAMLEAVMGEGFAKEAETGVNALPEELLQSIENFPLNTGTLKATLRRYQTFGTKYILHQERVLLGDEMGLGKTMQALAAFCHLAENGAKHFLVVCPLSVVVNWKREVESQTGLSAIEVYGDNRAMEMTIWAAQGGVAITSFETLNKLPIPAIVDLQLMVVDEAHYVKNPEAQRTKSVMAAAARAKRVLFMSGTPLENKVEEMQFLIQCLQPQVAEQIKDMKQIIHAEQFRKAIAPVYLRRVREDVLKELPELVEKEQWGLMNQEEMNAYKDALVNGSFMAVRQVSWQISDMSKSTKAQRLKEICEDAREGGRKLIIFSFFKDVLSKVSAMLGEYCIGVIDGSVPASDRQGMIDKLKEAPAGSALVCQIQAGGVGLNIQAASVVVFCEPQIKPSLETQAVARAYRMGQSQSVMVHRLLMDDTVDERVMEILKQKSQLFDNFADESIIGEMDTQINENAVMKDIVAEERKRLGLENGAETKEANSSSTETTEETTNQTTDIENPKKMEEATTDIQSAEGTMQATSDNKMKESVESDVAVEQGSQL